jgi:hypothetical protein
VFLRFSSSLYQKAFELSSKNEQDFAIAVRFKHTVAAERSMKKASRENGSLIYLNFGKECQLEHLHKEARDEDHRREGLLNKEFANTKVNKEIRHGSEQNSKSKGPSVHADQNHIVNNRKNEEYKHNCQRQCKVCQNNSS